MTSVKFLADEKDLCGFEISGHSSENCDDELGRLVCSAVSSAAYMTVNTVTDIIGDKAKCEVDDARMYFEVKSASPASVAVIKGFKLHLKGLSEQYGNNIRIFGGVKYVKD